VLEDLVEVASVSGIWNQQAHLRDAAALRPMKRFKSPAKSRFINGDAVTHPDLQPEEQCTVPWKGRRRVYLPQRYVKSPDATSTA
jgi:hypothetical protein